MGKNVHFDFTQGLLSGNRKICSEYLNDFFDKGWTLIQIYEGIIKQSLYEIGELWESNKITVATEHLASAVTESLLSELYDKRASINKKNKIAIVACVEKEVHQIGARMVSDVFEMNGWNVFFLGANTPTFELIKFTSEHKPDVIAISVSIFFHIPDLEKLIIEIRKSFPDLLILVGGQAFRKGGFDILTKYRKIKYLSNLVELQKFTNMG